MSDYCKFQGAKLKQGGYDMTRGHFVCQRCGGKEGISMEGMSIDFFAPAMQVLGKLFTKQHSKCQQADPNAPPEEIDRRPLRIEIVASGPSFDDRRDA